MFEKLTINKKLRSHLDFVLITVTIIIVLFGCLNINSALKTMYYAKLQFNWLLLSLAVVYFTLLVDYKLIKNYVPIIYWTGVFLLVLNDFVLGKTTKGATAWISIGSRAIQPSEFAKLGMILMLALLLEQMEGKINEPKNFFKLVFYAFIPMSLIVIQPDMGMTMVSFFIVLGIFFIFGLDLKVIIGGFVGIIGLVLALWNSSIMPAYWKTRLTSFLTPEEFSQGATFQLQQSLIGIGSGKLFGEGYGQGVQLEGNLIPEAFTDFIFAVVAEEWGFIGTLFLLTLYGILIYRMIKIAKESGDLFGSVVAIGVVSTFVFSLIQNIGMTIGLMPVTGITLPLMSYGGSSLLSNYIGIALVLNIGMRRKKIIF
ncbi:rod shape-determining protein RodA [Clostridium grantii]|uniref:Rod shape determining protein RodA n=1 Tax=Clostridium grantii DSM 8605 TaxID=1121316 RepID=A0A1M5X3I6_9CLOT|nr:rod shape-determining protein RodA [Clostridium grantii]SHH94369.1 rod shape determining protein RodA [Clostridium grantii DSM 8605]